MSGIVRETYPNRCLNHASTGCTGFSGGYDTYICREPCRLQYDMETRTYFREVEA